MRSGFGKGSRLLGLDNVNLGGMRSPRIVYKDPPSPVRHVFYNLRLRTLWAGEEDRKKIDHIYYLFCSHPASTVAMGKLIPNTFNLAVVIYVALGSTACSYGMAIIGSDISTPFFQISSDSC